MGPDQRDCYCGLDSSTRTATATSNAPPGFCGICEVRGQPGHTRHFPGAAPVTGSWCDLHYRRTSWLHPMGRYGRWLYSGIALMVLLIAIALRARRWGTRSMEGFAAAVNAVIDELESTGHEIVEAEFEDDYTPNVVARHDRELLFVLVQSLMGPHLSRFSEEIFHTELLPAAAAV